MFDCECQQQKLPFCACVWLSWCTLEKNGVPGPGKNLNSNIIFEWYVCTD